MATHAGREEEGNWLQHMRGGGREGVGVHARLREGQLGGM